MAGAHTMVANSLTPKELEVLALIAQGHDAKSAASELSISYHTIYERLKRARTKLGVSSSREAARIVFQTENHQKFVSENLGLVVAEPVMALIGSSGVPTTKVRYAGEGSGQSILPTSLWSAVLGSLPLRAPDERIVQLSTTHRLQLVFSLSAKLALTFVAVCFAAMIASTLFGRG
jgi:DNA-binding CsgD family transcriptional regulator